MPLTPVEARQRQLQHSHEAILRACIRIDTALAQGRRCVSLSGDSAIVQGEIVRLYGAAGWIVTVTDDQRDGGYYSLRERPSRPYWNALDRA